MVHTRGAMKKEQERSTKEGPVGETSDVGSEGAKVGKMETGCHTSKKTSMVSSKKSFQAKKKQLELEAAEAVAKLQKDIIEKKLAADIAALEEECSVKSRESCASSIYVSQKVNQWLEQSQHENEEPRRTNASSPHQHLTDHVRNDTALVLPTTLPAATPPTDFQQLAQAIKDIAVAYSSNAPNAKMLSRLCTPRDLPTFYGDPMEWLSFKQAYIESTEVCHFSDKENMWRLRKCLKGVARESVTALLISAASPDAVMSTLELQFGQPEVILPRIIQDIKKLRPVNPEYHKDIVYFSVKVKNYVAAVLALGREEYLRGMGITSVILTKLPPVLISKWSDYGYKRIQEGTETRLQILSDFLSEEALKISKTSVTLSVVRSDSKRKHSDDNYQSVLVQGNAVSSDDKCQFCRVSKHNLSECNKFKKALRKDRWSYVKRCGLCYKCLVSRHKRETCPAPDCDKDNCGQSHHRLLHYKLKESSQNKVQITQLPDSEPNVECVTNTNWTSKVLLKVVPICIHSPKGKITVYALLDDGSTISLISAGLVERLGIRGNKQTLRMSGAWNKAELVCDSEVVDLKVSSVADEALFKIKVRTVTDLNLPVQNVPLSAKYKHLGNISHLVINGLFKPEILLGQDNYDLLMPLKIIKGNSNEPYATLTPLGWCVHGYTSNLPHHHAYHSSLLTSGERSDSVSDDEPILREIQEEVRRSFTLDSMGISTKPRENTEDVQAVTRLEQTSTLLEGRWHVGLPWKSVNSKMPNALRTAMRRLINVEKKMKANEGFSVRYTERVRHLFENDFAHEIVTPEPSTPRTWYLPHFGVDNPKKKKLRLVFDAAAKSHGVCLNDYLLKGPDLLMSLYGIMLRFREKKIEVTADIKDHFL